MLRNGPRDKTISGILMSSNTADVASNHATIKPFNRRGKIMNKKLYISFLYIILLLSSAGCTNSVTEPETTVVNGKYTYSAFDRDNNLVATGYITISVNDSTISGTKNIQNVGSEPQPESGEENIHGKIIGANRIEILLLETGGPNLTASGIYKNGVISGSRIYWSATGVWIDTLGKFEAKFTQR